jgi:chromosomal replication initiation ATPase DnaA
MTSAKKIDKENKEKIRKYAKELLGDKYFLTFINKDVKKGYCKEVLNDIPKVKEVLKKVQKELKYCTNFVSRKPEIICQRYALMYHLKNNLNLRQRAIAHVMTNKDHSTVIHGCKKVADYISIKDDLYLETLNKIKTVV